jgi:hypothetical protein
MPDTTRCARCAAREDTCATGANATDTTARWNRRKSMDAWYSFAHRRIRNDIAPKAQIRRRSAEQACVLSAGALRSVGRFDATHGASLIRDAACAGCERSGRALTSDLVGVLSTGALRRVRRGDATHGATRTPGETTSCTAGVIPSTAPKRCATGEINQCAAGETVPCAACETSCAAALRRSPLSCHQGATGADDITSISETKRRKRIADAPSRERQSDRALQAGTSRAPHVQASRVPQARPSRAPQA